MITESPAKTPDAPVKDTPRVPRRLARVAGLDSIRLLMALWVVLSHVGLLSLHALAPTIHATLVLDKVLGSFICGPAAVVVFFVISGFCIHIPYHRGKALNLASYFVRREVRIGIPVIVTSLIGMFVVHDKGFYNVFWSLFCEEVYYSLYPFMLSIRRKTGSWTPVLAFSTFVSAMSLMIFLPTASEPIAFYGMGYKATWMLGWPIWILGCILAETCDDVKEWDRPKLHIWLWRGLVWSTTVGIEFFRFHGHHWKSLGDVSYAITLPVFGILAYFWLKQEISYYSTHPTNKLLEKGGLASYTLYLTHHLCFAILGFDGGVTHAHPLQWCEMACVIVAFTTAFFYLVEGPSHRLARKLGDKLDGIPAKRLAATTA